MKTTCASAAILLSILDLFGLAAPVPAGDASPYTLNPPPSINPALPNILLLGDSISIGYTPFVRTKLSGKANVYGIAGSEAATVRTKGTLKLDTKSALEHLDNWLQDKKWAVIHFNWGLHDLKVDQAGEHQVPLADYERNLRSLVVRLHDTHASLIWASTTPVPAGADHGANARKAGDEVSYNETAQRVMDENHIPVDDLHALISPRIHELQRPANVHFTDAGSELMGRQVASLVETALENRDPKAGK
jgi:lysophospholipase L1-like esterase